MVGQRERRIPALVLASSSPRRSQVLATLELQPTVVAAEIDEARRPDEPATAMVIRLATDKLMAGWVALRSTSPPVDSGLSEANDVLILAADTVVEIGDSILGKPAGEADAVQMLTMLSGRRHRVHTGLAVARGSVQADSPQDIVSSVETTEVTMRTLEPDLIHWYVATEEPLDKAGAYGIQGRGGLLVDGISGSYPNVVGLPIVALDRLCRRLGWPLHRLSPARSSEGRDLTAADVASLNPEVG